MFIAIFASLIIMYVICYEFCISPVSGLTLNR